MEKRMSRYIPYKYYHWGPYLSSFKVEEPELQAIEKLFNKEKDNSYRSSLAGHVVNEFGIDKDKCFGILAPYIESYCMGYVKYTGLKLCNKLEVTSCWVNYMVKNEFNPPHAHEADLSFVLYTQVPKDLIEENKKFICIDLPKGKIGGAGPGGIEFISSGQGLCAHSFFPEVGDLFIFPADLLHWVYPFRESEGERISVSGNLNVIW